VLVNLQIDKAPEKGDDEGDPSPDGGEGKGDVPAPDEEFAPNQGDEEPSGDASAPPSNLPDVPIFKVGDRAMFNGVLVEVTHAGLPDPKTGRQDLQFAPVIDD